MVSIVLLLLACLGLSLVVALPRTVVGGRRLFLVRVLFPSWRFFESIGVVARLYVREVDGERGYQNWTPALKAPPLSWSNLFFNPHGNLYFAQQSAVEHLVSEIEESEEGGSLIEHSPAFALVHSIARDSIRSGVASANGSLSFSNGFQFKVSLLDEDGVEEDLMISPLLSARVSS
ncbi:MAG: hypothetical protein KGQ59_00895 [Bdellovibrionales bacterium]|nr:hypothetical protein [Bdellovibrionales bacterium]